MVACIETSCHVIMKIETKRRYFRRHIVDNLLEFISLEKAEDRRAVPSKDLEKFKKLLIYKFLRLLVLTEFDSVAFFE